MKKGFFIFLLCSFILVSQSNLWAHSVVYEVKEISGITIKVEYDDGEPMSYAEVLIYSPVDEEIEYQNGRTDKRGCFSFLPDQPGEWKIMVDDGMAHGIVAKVLVEEGITVKILHHGFPRWQKLITGISIILGLTGLLFYLVARKRTHGS